MRIIQPHRRQGRRRLKALSQGAQGGVSARCSHARAREQWTAACLGVVVGRRVASHHRGDDRAWTRPELGMGVGQGQRRGLGGTSVTDTCARTCTAAHALHMHCAAYGAPSKAAIDVAEAASSSRSPCAPASCGLYSAMTRWTEGTSTRASTSRDACARPKAAGSAVGRRALPPSLLGAHAARGRSCRAQRVGSP